MGHKVHPTAFRLGFIKDWTSRWFSAANYREFLREDTTIRTFLDKEFARSASIEKIEIERSANLINVIIYTARPGILIGRGGASVDVIKKSIESIIFKIRNNKKGLKMPEVRMEIREVKHPEAISTLIAYEVASGLERRMPYRRVLKKAIEKSFENEDVKGIKISVSGRLNGAEIARTEWLVKGRVPLHTLRADIDYCSIPANTTFGAIGIKVWIYKGEVFNNKTTSEEVKQDSRS